MKLINEIKRRWLNYKKKKLINNQFKHLVGKPIYSNTTFDRTGGRVSKKRVNELTNHIYNGLRIKNVVENKDKQFVNDRYVDKLYLDFKALINKHFSKENKELKNQIKSLERIIKTKECEIF
ncbi:MAG: hypothetical protein ACOC33_03875 [bacterium]